MLPRLGFTAGALRLGVCLLAGVAVSHQAIAVGWEPGEQGWQPEIALVSGADGFAGISALREYAHTRGDPLFADDFDRPELDRTDWPQARGAFISSDAIAPPSVPNALRLGPGDVGVARPVEILSRVIPLDDVPAAHLSFYTQHRGVESGKWLVIEYWSDRRQWSHLGRVVSDGVDQRRFRIHRYELPPDARHGGFRMRLRIDSDDVDDRWYVDSVRVERGRFAITVRSIPLEAVPLQLMPGAMGPREQAFTPITCAYDASVNVTLIAPRRTADAAFLRWSVNSRAQAEDQNILTHRVEGDALLVAEYVFLGDMNGDGNVDQADIDPFILSLIDPGEYARRHPELGRVRRGDVNGDGVFDALDIDAFIELVLEPDRDTP